MTMTEDYAIANGHDREPRSDKPTGPTLVTLEAIDGTGSVTIQTGTLDDLRALSILTRTDDHELLRRAVEWLRLTSLTQPRTPKADNADGGPAKKRGAKS